MTPELAIVAVLSVLLGIAIGLCLYICWQLSSLRNEVYEIRWDLDGFLASFEGCDDDETPESPRH